MRAGDSSHVRRKLRLKRSEVMQVTSSKCAIKISIPLCKVIILGYPCQVTFLYKAKVFVTISAVLETIKDGVLCVVMHEDDN